MAKYPSQTESGECIFCKIVNGSLKTPGVFWEDDDFMAFLSIFPNTKGFSVVIPKKHFGSDVLAMPDKDLKKFIVAAKKVSNVLRKGFSDVGRVGLLMEGLGVDHAHIKLFPMHGTEFMDGGEWKQILCDKSDFYDKYPGYISSHDGPEANVNELKKLAERLKKVRG